MKIQAWLLLILIAILLAGGMLAARNASADGQVLSGGGYHLTLLTWQTSGVSSGGEYTLRSPVSPALTGSGCCCLYLPCVKKAP